jgi:elongation factor Ts
MAEITAGMVKDLREKTGVGMMDCKAALAATNGDMEAAVDWLRAKGLAKAAKKSTRVAAEGLVAVAVDGTTGAVVEVNSETDFVARNDKFQAMVTEISKLALKADGNTEKLKTMHMPGSSHAVAEYVLVALESTGNKAALSEFARLLSMHVAATNPVALTLEQVPKDVLARESAILEEKNAGKPANVLEKIVASGLKTFAKENCLLEQAYVHDGAKTVTQAIAEAAKAAGADVRLTGFVRMQLGEGIEKKEDDFAAEVAKMSGGQ